MSGISDFFVHTVQVETYQGTGASGDVYAAPATVPGFLEGQNVLVRDAAGNMVTASSTFYCAVADSTKFTPDSRVTSDGRVSYVISQNRNDSAGLNLPDHTMVRIK